jgi:hypothetical protein
MLLGVWRGRRSDGSIVKGSKKGCLGCGDRRLEEGVGNCMVVGVDGEEGLKWILRV